MTWLFGLWGLLKKAPAWLWGALAVVGGLLVAYLRGRASGRASERQKATEEALERKVETEKIEREIEGLPDEALDKRGKPWLRP